MTAQLQHFIRVNHAPPRVLNSGGWWEDFFVIQADEAGLLLRYMTLYALAALALILS